MAGLVVLHVRDDADDVPRALSAAEFITTREPMRVQIIVNGAAVTGLAAEGLNDREVELGDGVTIFACERALHREGLSPQALRGGVETVPSAVIALARTQHEGAAYIRI